MIQELIPGDLYQITLPLPFELEHVNVHLSRLTGKGGWMLHDTGFGNSRSFEVLDASLRELNIAWAQIKLLLLTHSHPDHVGLTDRIKSLASPRVLMHAAEAEHLNEMIVGKPTWFEPLHIFGGTPPDRIRLVDEEFLAMRRKLQRIDPDVLLHGGETLETAHGSLEVIWTPGHAVGHICLYSRVRKWLFSGDTILKEITPNIGWLPGLDTLGDYLRSLQTLSPYEIDLVLPSHGKSFNGHREWIAETSAHHEERCQLILKGADEFRTAHELIGSVWSREFSHFHYHFAIGEVLAHLVYLERTGRVQRRDSENGAAGWRRVV